MLLCKTCDAEVQPGQIFCVNCGARTENNTYTSDAAPVAQPASDATVLLDHAGAPVADALPPVVPVAPAAPSTPVYDDRRPLEQSSPVSFPPAPANVGPAYQPTPNVQQTSTLAVVSLIFGILGVLQLLPLISPLIAVITGHMARREIRAAHGQVLGDGMAITGLILGYALLLIGVLLCGLFVLLIPLAALNS